MLRKLRRLSKLSPFELLVLIQLIFFALVARATLAFFSLPRIIKFLSVLAENPVARRFPLGHLWQASSQLAIVADLAARAIRPEGPCLLRSLLLFSLIKARGEHAELVIGVCKEPSSLEGHAWIESQGTVIADCSEVNGRYATLLRF